MQGRLTMNETSGSTPDKSRRGRNIGSYIMLSLVLLVGALCLGAPNFEQSRGQARHSMSKIQLRQIEQALLRYHDEYGSFPPATVNGPDGRPWHSWRVLLLPFLEHLRSEDDIYDEYRFDEPWDSPHNRGLAVTVKDGPYFAPSDERAMRDRTTSYVAVVGERAMWKPDGEVVRQSDVTDDPARTAHVIEMVESGILWTEPRDVDVDTMTFDVNAEVGEGIRGNHVGKEGWFGYHGPTRASVSLLDGTALVLTPKTPPDTVRSLLLRDDGGPGESWDR